MPPRASSSASSSSAAWRRGCCRTPAPWGTAAPSRRNGGGRAAGGRGGGMSTPSRFLGELPRELLAGPALSRSKEPGDDQTADWPGADVESDGEHAPGPADLHLGV